MTIARMFWNPRGYLLVLMYKGVSFFVSLCWSDKF